MNRLGRLDRIASQWLRTALPTGMRPAVSVVAHLFDLWVCLAILGIDLLCTWNGPWRMASSLPGIALVGMCSTGIKFTVRRQRPAGRGDQLVRTIDPYSFPSGHAARAALFAVLAWGMGSSWIFPVMLSLALAAGISRVMLSMHYVSDILAGLGLGGAVGVLLQLAPAEALCPWLSK